MARDRDPEVTARQDRVKFLLVSGMGPMAIARQLVSDGKWKNCEGREGETVDQTIMRVYSTVRQDISAIGRRATPLAARNVDAIADLYVGQQEALFREAIVMLADRALNPFARLQALALASQISERIAAVQGVNTRPKYEIDVHTTEDPAVEQMREVTELQKARAAGRMIDITPDKENAQNALRALDTP